MRGLSQFVHHIIGNVYKKIVLGVGAHGAQAPGHPIRRSDGFTAAGRDVFHHHPCIPAAEIGVSYLYRDGRTGRGEPGDLRFFKGQAVKSAELPGQRVMRKAIGQIRRNLDFQHAIGFIKKRCRVCADRRAFRQDKYAGIIIPVKAQFRGGADHSLGFHAAYFSLFKHAFRQHGPDPGEGNILTYSYIFSSADHFRHGRAVAHFAKRKLIGVRMFPDGEYPAHDHAGKRGSGFRRTLHVQTQPVQFGNKVIHAQRRADKIHQPRVQNFHLNSLSDFPAPDFPGSFSLSCGYICLSIRRSFSYSMRISLMPYRSMAKRSIPAPNANPLHFSGS